MARHRSVTSQTVATPTPAVDISTLTSGPSSAPPRQQALPTPEPQHFSAPSGGPLPSSALPSIRLMPATDYRSHRPSLPFGTITRTLPSIRSILKVGRYSEKDNRHPNQNTEEIVSDAPIGFKSKVVSRRHCEFFFEEGKWFVKDAKSSSGTFLNHIRLSTPGTESKPYPVKDGDLIQLGIDFKGGEEPIFRCVKIRVICNSGWQKSLSNYSKTAHKHLMQRQISRTQSMPNSSTECTICLNGITPCQALFVAPCSHTWHFRCIRPLIEFSPNAEFTYPNFQCPNCRSLANLEAEVDEAMYMDDSEGSEEAAAGQKGSNNDHTHLEITHSHDLSAPNDLSRSATAREDVLSPEAARTISEANSRLATMSEGDCRRPERSDGNPFLVLDPASLSGFRSVNIPELNENSQLADPVERLLTLNPSDPNLDGPMTPRNNAGPFVLDGSSAEATPDGGVRLVRPSGNRRSSLG